MSLKEGEKYFHLSEIFSYYHAGTQMYLPEQAKMPDGEFRSITLAFEAAVKVAEHISGEKLWNEEGPHQFDLWEFLDVCDEVDKALLEQLPWLEDMEMPPTEHKPDTPEILEKRRDWIRKKAVELGSEWFVLKRMDNPLAPRSVNRGGQPPNGLPLRPKKT